jgi:catechol 2,3-dioxygenase-like lactoylglutathione lyase family enzyme
MRALYDHVDVRVRDLSRVRSFYDPLCAALGLTTITEKPPWRVYESSDGSLPIFSLTGDPQHRAGTTRVAFRAETRAEVDRIAEVARSAGATAFEPPQLSPEYTPDYYATFFADPDGNEYEVCHRHDFRPHVARIWRGRVRPDALRDYGNYVARTGLRDYLETPGNRGAYVLTRQQPSHGEIVTLSLWTSRDVIAAFAGEPIDRARYYPDDAAYLLDFPEHVEHYDVVAEDE